jgi:type IV pilus assembly protein PilN
MRISINLATRPFADLGPALKRLRIGMGILAIVAIVFGIGLHSVHSKADQARQRERVLDAQVARITQERQGYQDMMNRPDNAQLLKQADALNRLFDEKAFSWTLAMENLETVLPAGVQVSTIEPAREKDGHISLHLRVVGPRDRSVELVRNLEHSRRFLQPRIVGETSENNNLPNQRLEPVSGSNRFTFDLFADYNPPTPEEAKAAAAKRAKAIEQNAKDSAQPAPMQNAIRRPARPPYVPPAQGGPR